MKAGFGKSDITPRVGVELCGYGPFINRHSIGIRDRLWARAMAVEQAGKTAIIVSCDLVGVPRGIVREVRRLVASATGVPAEAILVHCTHTHSGPGIGVYIGWGEADPPYLEVLPQKIAKACIEAAAHRQEAVLSHAEAPCEGMSYNRVYDDCRDLNATLHENWRPAKPDLTDTTCHALKVEAEGKLIGFLSYFGCHPVCCYEDSRYIHGDYAGVATNEIEREHPGAIGLFLQGAQGDVNACCVGLKEQEALLGLDVIAGRYARSVRAGMAAAKPVAVDAVKAVLNEVTFTRRPWDLDKLRAMLAEQEAVLHAPDATETAHPVRMAMVCAIALRKLIAMKEAGQSLEPGTDVQGIRIGPIALLASPFEVFRAIKCDVVARAKAPIPLVMGLTNDSIGYAPDRNTTPKHRYAADKVPLICGSVPFADIHNELVCELLRLDAALT